MRRLDQILASLGYGSRSEVREVIAAGRVTVGGKPETDAARKADAHSVRIDGEELDHPEGILLLLNKPAGLVCSHSAEEGPNVFGLLSERWRARNPPVTSIGRLDKETTGLLLLTDRSELVHRLTSPRSKVEKVYRAVLDQAPPAGAEEAFCSGTLLLPGDAEPCAPARLRRISDREMEVTLTEGRYHQVRRMFAGQGCQVTALERISFGTLELGGLPLGQWKHLPINSL
ncbi:MAG TPA: pseudouridine synthase [Opitutaceae bacterium]